MSQQKKLGDGRHTWDWLEEGKKEHSSHFRLFCTTVQQALTCQSALFFLFSVFISLSSRAPPSLIG
jgi:hypothetical protein